MLLSTADHFGSSSQQRVSKKPTEKSAPITFTIETKEKAVTFFDPLAIRVVLHNNSPSPIFFNSGSLRLISESWHVVGTWGQWSGDEGMSLSPENHVAGRIELPAGGSFNLAMVEQWPTFES